MQPRNDPLTRDLLRWIADRPRTHAELIQVWRTTCPRLSIWEDALLAGLVKVEHTAAGSQISLTPRGQALLEIKLPETIAVRRQPGGLGAEGLPARRRSRSE